MNALNRKKSSRLEVQLGPFRREQIRGVLAGCAREGSGGQNGNVMTKAEWA